MPLKIHYPKRNGPKHKQKLIVIQGTCDDSTKVTGVLTDRQGNPIAGAKLTSNNLKHWGYRYKLPKDTYKFAITQTNSPVIEASVDFEVDPLPPPPLGTPPTVTAPAPGDDVAAMIYPFGTSNAAQQITELRFFGNGQDVTGMITQQTNVDGDWEGQIDVSACPSSGGYTVRAANNTGPTDVGGLRIP